MPVLFEPTSGYLLGRLFFVSVQGCSSWVLGAQLDCFPASLGGRCGGHVSKSSPMECKSGDVSNFCLTCSEAKCSPWTRTVLLPALPRIQSTDVPVWELTLQWRQCPRAELLGVVPGPLLSCKPPLVVHDEASAGSRRKCCEAFIAIQRHHDIFVFKDLFIHFI